MKVWFKWVWPGVGPFAEFDRKQNGNLDGYFVINITATKKHSNMFLLFCISQISTRYGFLLGIPFYRSMARLYTITGLDQWTGPLDWTTGLQGGYFYALSLLTSRLNHAALVRRSREGQAMPD